MFIQPIRKDLPPSQTGIKSAVNGEQIHNFINILIKQRGEWFAFWEANVCDLKNVDAARMSTLHFVKSKHMMRAITILGAELEYATRKRDGVLTAYARIK
jgi:hypothetical protein